MDFKGSQLVGQMGEGKEAPGNTSSCGLGKHKEGRDYL